MAGAYVDVKEVYELSGYLQSMESRLTALQRIAEQIDFQLDQVNNGVLVKKNALRREIGDLSAEAQEMTEMVRSSQKVILQMIIYLKSSVKNDEFERLKKRIDLWAPETNATRNEVNKIIDEL